MNANNIITHNSEKLLSTRSYERKKFKKMFTEIEISNESFGLVENQSSFKKSKTTKNIEKKIIFFEEQDSPKDQKKISTIRPSGSKQSL